MEHYTHCVTLNVHSKSFKTTDCHVPLPFVCRLAIGSAHCSARATTVASTAATIVPEVATSTPARSTIPTTKSPKPCKEHENEVFSKLLTHEKVCGPGASYSIRQVGYRVWVCSDRYARHPNGCCVPFNGVENGCPSIIPPVPTAAPNPKAPELRSSVRQHFIPSKGTRSDIK